MTDRPDLLLQARQLCARVHDGALLTPFSGRWNAPERLDQDLPVLAVDEQISRLLVDETTGAVLMTDDSGRHPINSSIGAFAACAQAYTDAMHEVASRGLDDADHDDELEQIEQALLRRYAELDPALPSGEDDFWIVAAEEIGLGTAPYPAATPAPIRRPDPPRPFGENHDRILLAMTDTDRDRRFTTVQWKRLTSLAPITLLRSPPAIETAVDLIHQTAAARGNPAPRPTVLVTTDTASLTQGLWIKLPALKLVCLLAPAAPDQAPPIAVGITLLPPDADGEAIVDTITHSLVTGNRP